MIEIVLPLIAVLTVPALIIPVLEPVLGKRVGGRISGYIAIAALLTAILLAIYSVSTSTGVMVVSTSTLFSNDLLASFFTIAVLTVSIIVAVASLEYMKTDSNISIFYSLLLFTALGMSLLAFANDLIMLLVSWELMSLPTYVLAGFKKKDPLSNEASIKYFLLGALSSGIILYGISLAYGLTGSTNISAVIKGFTTLTQQLHPLSLAAVALFIAGFGLKMSIVPFHMWIPDTYEGAPTPVGALLAAGTKKAGFAAAIRVFLTLIILFKVDLTTTFAILALITMTLGNVAALTQKSITRLLAYSSIAQAGYILIGFAVAPTSGLALIGVLYHVFNHAVMKSTAFIAAAIVLYKLARTDLDSYNGLSRRMPITSFTMAVSLLALAGVPPLNGFWSKLVLFAAAIEGDMAWLAVAGVLNSAFSLGYYAWIIKRMYIDEPTSGGRVSEPLAFTIVLIAATVIIIGTGVYPNPIYDFASRAASVP